jgi:hypothetical protein
MDLGELKCEYVDWSQLAHDRLQWHTFVNMVMKYVFIMHGILVTMQDFFLKDDGGILDAQANGRRVMHFPHSSKSV